MCFHEIFHIERTNTDVKKNVFSILKDRLTVGAVRLGTFGGLDFYAFNCPNHGRQVDYEHGYRDGGHYYLSCKQCEYYQTI